MNRLTGYLGTYASAKSQGIYRFTVDLEDGTLSGPKLFWRALDCKYLSLMDSLLAFPVKEEKAGIGLLDISKGEAVLQGELLSESAVSCYITQDLNWIYTANYHEGTISIYEKTEEGPVLNRRIEIGEGAGCHQILFHGPLMLVPCLLLDQIKIFDRRRDYMPAGEIRFQKGTGPRHGVFDRLHRRLFLVSELTNELFVYQIKKEDFILKHRYTILPEGKKYEKQPASAALRLSPDERFLYVSTRFADRISVFLIKGDSLEMIQQIESKGSCPRDIMLTPDGRFLLAANQMDGSLVSFLVDSKSGKILSMQSRITVPQAVSIVWDETQ